MSMMSTNTNVHGSMPDYFIGLTSAHFKSYVQKENLEDESCAIRLYQK